jgi:hypothetical protein
MLTYAENELNSEVEKLEEQLASLLYVSAYYYICVLIHELVRVSHRWRSSRSK